MKPKKKSRQSYDYSECRDFLEEKYGYSERDYLGRYAFGNKAVEKVSKKYGKSWYTTIPTDFNEQEKLASEEYHKIMLDEPEYCDFWHWVCDHCYNVSNGCYITFSRECLESYKDDDEGMPPFVKQIYSYYLDEFADKNGELEMWVEW